MQSRFRQQLVKYLFMLKWLALDFVWRYRWRVGRLMALRFAGIALQLTTFGLIAQYARLLETDATMSLFGEVLQARESVLLLVLIGVAALVAMIVGSALIVFSTRGIERLCADYEAHCGKRVLEIAGQSTQLQGPDFLDENTERLIMKLTKRYPRLLRRMTKALLTSLLPGLLVVAIVLPVLLMLNVWLTLIVLGLVTVSLILQYRLNVRAAQSSLTMERTARDAAREYKSVVEQIAQSMQPLERETIERPFAAKAVRRNLDAYFTRVTATNESQFITDCFTAVILVVVLITLGGSILREGEGWAALLVYLLALRYGMGQVRSTLAAFAGVNRYFHQAKAYSLFLDADHDRLEGAGPGPDSLTIRCAMDDAFPESQDELVVRSGDRIAVLCPFQPTRFQLRALYAVLLGDGSNALRAVISNTILVPDAESLQGDVIEQTVKARGGQEPKSGSLSMIILGERALRSQRQRNGSDVAPTAPLVLEAGQACLSLIRKPNSVDQSEFDAVVVTDGDRVNWIGRPDRLHLILDLLELDGTGRRYREGDDGDDLDDELSEDL